MWTKVEDLKDYTFMDETIFVAIDNLVDKRDDFLGKGMIEDSLEYVKSVN